MQITGSTLSPGEDFLRVRVRPTEQDVEHAVNIDGPAAIAAHEAHAIAIEAAQTEAIHAGAAADRAAAAAYAAATRAFSLAVQQADADRDAVLVPLVADSFARAQARDAAAAALQAQQIAEEHRLGVAGAGT